MKANTIRIEFFETYYYANIIDNILTDTDPYVRGINDWFEDNEENIFLPAFPKFSRLHGFAAHVIDSLICETITDTEHDPRLQQAEYEIWIDRAIRYHGFECYGFNDWLSEHSISRRNVDADDLYDYHQEIIMSGALETLVEHLAKEVFHVLFANRKLLARFNGLMAGEHQYRLDEIPDSELGRCLKSPGVLKRVNIPSWVKRTVFFRDRGCCTICQKDLSGLISAQPDSQYDHIIPLARGGINDVTNIQLLCQPCNLKKSADIVPVSNIYEAWY